MQALGYGDEVVEVGMNQPSPEAYHGEVQENRAHQKKFVSQLLLLARVDNDCFSEMTEAEVELMLLMRLLRLDHDVMGKRAVKSIRVRVAYWKSVSDGKLGKVRGYQSQDVQLGRPFAQMMQEQKWIIIPKRCRTQETLPASTINVTENFPPRGQRNLPSFAKIFGFHYAQDCDENGKNIFTICLRRLNIPPWPVKSQRTVSSRVSRCWQAIIWRL